MLKDTIQGKIHEIFDIYPENAAIEYKGCTLTYRELKQKAKSVSRSIVLKGIPKGTFIGILVEDKIQLIELILGILEANCVFVPLDSRYPSKRLLSMIKAVDMEYIFSDKLNKDKLENLEEDMLKQVILEPEEFLYTADCYEAVNENAEYTADDSIYVYFTSGTTGVPKAIVGRNKSLLHFIEWELETFGINSGTKVSQLTSQCHDPFLRDIFVPLCSGGTICIPEGREIILESSNMIKWIESSGINLIHCTPSLFKIINAGTLKSDNLSSLKYVLLAGERVNPQALVNWYGVFEDRITLVNIYGPTETTLAKVFYIIKPEDALKKTIPIGKPIKGAKVALADENLKMCPLGTVGEIIIRTPYRTKGYYNDTEMNKRNFIPNPFGKDPQDLVYRTGDLGKLLPDGNIEFVGRRDRQVKIRGFRIELNEIESLLLKHAKVKEAVVVERSTAGDVYLAAYIVKQDEKKDIISELTEYLEQRLPDYMIPRYFMNLERIPLTLNGKTDYKALPEIINTCDEEYIAPRNATEAEIEKIWCEILVLPHVGVNKSFLMCGGHSLNMMAMISKINHKFKVTLSFEEVFEKPTIERIAILIEHSAVGEDTIKRLEEREYYTVSSAQRRIYVLSQLEGAGTGYNIPGAIEIEGVLDLERFKSAFARLVKCQESLKTYFELMDGEPVQKIKDDVEPDIEYLDMTDKETGKELLEFSKPFRLDMAPLFRLRLVKIKSDRHMLLYDIHHIISDALSMDILIKEFAELYAGREPDELPISYRDYAKWQTEQLQSDRVKKQEEYWKSVYGSDIPVLKLPADFARPAIQSFEGRKLNFEIGAELKERLYDICREKEVTSFMLFLAAYFVQLYKYTGQEDIIVGTPIAGRNNEQLENIIGVFINTLALRNYPCGSLKFTDFLSQVKENSLKAYQNQEYPFEELIDKLNLSRDFSRNPLFDTMFEFQTKPQKDIEINGLKFTSYHPEDGIAKFDIRLQGFEKLDSIEFELEYCTKLFAQETMNRFAVNYRNILEKIALNPDIKLCDIEMLSQEERNQLIYGFNSTHCEFPKDKTVHQLFSEQAKLNPEKLALKCGDEKYSYLQLEQFSNRMARYLRKRGVGREDLGVILMERSPLMAGSILALWKAGAAYVPIDTDYPAERIIEIINDSEAKCILTKSKYASPELKNKYDGKLIELDSLLNEIQSESPEYVEQQSGPENLAYVLYTSGSTGKPKGAMVEHIGMMNHIIANAGELKLDGNSRIAQNASHCFDISVWQFVTALMLGGQTVIYPNELILNPHKFIECIANDNITMLEVVPSFLSLLLDYPEENEKLSKLKYLLVTGEAVNAGLIKRWFKLHPDIPVVNAYGPTEASDDITLYTMTGPVNTDNIPIGKPIQNMSIYITDNDMQLCPAGAVGEICVSGVGVGRGYLNDAVKTAASFMENPFEDRKGQRLYKTGDLGRWLPDGNIEFFGRKDFQVKIRGFRIELSEIENRLTAHPDIKEAVVTDRQDKLENKYLCAYIMTESELSVPEIKKFLSETLPNYMLPSCYVKMEKFPLTNNGKIDRKSLPAPELKTEAGAEYNVPVSRSQIKIAEIWQEILGLDRVGLEDNFFECGGNSLKGIKMISLLEKEGIRLKINDVLHYQTVRELAEYVDSMKEEQAEYIQTVGEAEKALYDKFNTIAKFNILSFDEKVYYILKLSNPEGCSEGEVEEFIRENVHYSISPHYIIFNENEGCIGDDFTKAAGLISEGIKEKCERIDRLLKEGEAGYVKAVMSKASVSKFPLSPVQKYSTENYENAGIIIKLDRYINTELLSKALLQVVKEHQLLRSEIEKADGELYWLEHEAPEAIAVPFIDISEYDVQAQQEIIKHVMSTYFYDTIPYLKNLCYRVSVFKANLREYYMLMPFNHIGADEATGEILRREITSAYLNLEKAMKAEAIINSNYSDYVGQVMKGPQNTSGEEIFKVLEIDEYAKYFEIIDKQVKEKPEGAVIVDYEAEFRSNGFDDAAVWEITFALANMFYSKYFNVEKIPLWTTSYGRLYEGKGYFNIVGEFLDFVPLLVDINNLNCGELIKDARNKLDFISEHNINFANLLYDSGHKDEYRKLTEIVKMQDKSNTVSFNFQGKLDTDELEVNKELKYKNSNFIEDMSGCSKILFMAKYTNEKIRITVYLPFEEESAKVYDMLEVHLKEIISARKDIKR